MLSFCVRPSDLSANSGARPIYVVFMMKDLAAVEPTISDLTYGN